MVSQKNRYTNNSSARSGPLTIFRRILGSILGVCCLLVFFALLSWGLLQGYKWITTTSYFAAKNIHIKGNKRLKRDEILDKADLSRGKNLLKISIGEIENKLINNPWIKKVAVRRKLPDEVSINIQEISPVFWVRKGERIFYARANGEIISPVKGESPVSLPLLYYQDGKGKSEQDLLYLKRQLRDKELPFSMAEISWIEFVSNGIVEMFLQDIEVLIKIGRENIKSNCRFLGKIWRDLAKRGELGTVKTIRVYQRKGWVAFNHKVVAN